MAARALACGRVVYQPRVATDVRWASARCLGAAAAIGKRAPTTCGARRHGTAAAASGKQKLLIFDTTLRDGEQSPGCTLQIHEKLAIAHQLAVLGVDVCEAGFPIASQGDFEAVSIIAREVGQRTAGRPDGHPMTIAGLARATAKDIDRCFDAVRHAPRHRVHVFLATSDLHLKYKLNISRSEAIRRAVAAIEHAATLCADIEFSAEDAGRSDRAFLADIIGAVIAAGAKTINVPDTVGYTLPKEYGALFSELIATTRGAAGVTWSTHCHNDLGLAVANTLSAVEAGARQVEVTMNGIGERAGNCALEEVVMAINVRPAMFAVTTAVDTTQITKTSRMVSSLTGSSVQPNKAIVGSNAFAHESGIHQDGMLKNASTYEIMTPTSVGLHKSALVLGKHSGRAAFKDRLRDLGFTETSGRELDELVEKLKALADENKVITDADIQSLVFSGIAQPDAAWTLGALQVTTGAGLLPTAAVTMRHRGGAETSASALGTGPIDAVYNAIKSVVGRANDLTHFSVQSVTDGQTALGEVTIRVSPAESGPGRRQVAGLKRVKAPPGGGGGKHAPASAQDGAGEPAAASPPVFDGGDYGDPLHGGRVQYVGTFADKDIIVAAAHAYVAALNRLLAADAANVSVRGAGAGGGV